MSKLSGWLKAFAFCRVEREEFVPRRQHVWAGKREKLDEGEMLLAPVTAAQTQHKHSREGHWGLGAGHIMRGACPKHVSHGCNAGRVET